MACRVRDEAIHGALRSSYLAAGYASDDEPVRRPAPRRQFGQLPGDEQKPRRLSAEEVLEYGARKNSAGPASHKVRFLDVLLASRGSRPSRAQTLPRNALQRHCTLLSWLRLPGCQLAQASARRAEAAPKSDLDFLRESHRFLRSSEDDDGSWEANLAKRYYERLFREYVICDLAGYKKGNIGFRWRTETEVIKGKGQFLCGHKPCESKSDLKSYEVDFKYLEGSQKKRALVKARLCDECAYKLHYRRLQRDRRKRRSREEQLPPQKRQRRDERSRDAGAADDDDAGSDGLVLLEHDGPDQDGSGDGQDAAEKQRLLDAYSWKGPDPELRLREDDFDDYLNDLFL